MMRILKTEAEWREMLAPDQYHICREGGTEAPWTGCYLDHAEDGQYLCGCCGAAIFDSRHKYDAGTGWPSFYDVGAPWAVRVLPASPRRAVTCAACGAHLGYVFLDGPDPTGLRWSINSLALAFAPRRP